MSEAGAYFVVFARQAEGPFAEVEEALAFRAGSFPGPTWRESLEPAEGEVPCPICGAPRQRVQRYPRALCPVCVLEAVDQKGNDIRFYNASMSGGLEPRGPDGARGSEPACWVRGVRCRAEPAHFGGVVVQTLAD